MKAAKGYRKEDYTNSAPVVKEFETVEQAAEYLAEKYGETTEFMKRSILNDTNCDAIYFDDGTTLILEF